MVGEWNHKPSPKKKRRKDLYFIPQMDDGGPSRDHDFYSEGRKSLF